MAIVALALPGAASAEAGFGPAAPLPWLDGSPLLDMAQGAPGEVILAGMTVERHDDGTETRYPQVAVTGPDRAAPTPQRLADSLVWGPVLAANRSGRAIVAWDSQPDDTSNALELATRDPGGAFTKSVPIPHYGGALIVRAAAIDAAGDGLVLFLACPFSNDCELDAVFVSATGAVSDRVKVADVGNNLDRVSAAVSEAGLATVAWSDSRTLDGSLQVADGDVHGFGAPQVVGPRPRQGQRLALDADGRAVLEWEAGEQGDVLVARRAAGVTFGQPVNLGTAGNGSAQMAVTGGGRVLVMWEGGIVGDGYTDSMLYGRIAEGDTRGGDFTRFYNGWGGAVGDLLLPVIAAEPGGHVAVARYPYRWFGGPTGGHEVLVSSGPVAGGFGPTHEVACPEAPAGAPAGLVLSGPDDMSLLLSDWVDQRFRYSLVRTVPGTPPGPEACNPVPPLTVSAPAEVRASALSGLTLSVASPVSGRFTLTGAVKRAGHTVRRFAPMRWRAGLPERRAVHLRLAKSLRPVGRVRGTATITVVLKGADGATHRKRARVRVRR